MNMHCKLIDLIIIMQQSMTISMSLWIHYVSSEDQLYGNSRFKIYVEELKSPQKCTKKTTWMTRAKVICVDASELRDPWSPNINIFVLFTVLHIFAMVPQGEFT